MKKNERFHRFVEVTWWDSHSSANWRSWDETLEQHKDPCICVTIGFLIKQDKFAVSVASSIGPNTGTYGGVWTIPRGMVKRIRYLTWLRKKK